MLRVAVVDDITGKPVARAKISIESLHGSPVPFSGAALADSAGHYEIATPNAGTFLVKAERTGYAKSVFGERQWGQPGTPIVLEKDSEFLAVVRLRRLGAVNGHVLDENGLGLTGVAVSAIRDGKRLRTASTAVTDDRGVFRLAGLEPGRYLVRTAARALEDKRGLLPTYFGQSTNAAGAQRLAVDLGQEAEGADIAPVPGSLSSLVVSVTSTTPATVFLHSESGTKTATAGPGQEARFDELEPGRYLLRAEGGGPGQLLSAWREVVLSQESERADLALAPSPYVQFRCAEQNGKSLDPQTISAFLQLRDDPEPRKLTRVLCGESVQLAAGRWELAVSAPAGSYIASVSNATIGELGYEVMLMPRRNVALAVTVSSQGASVKGVVKMANGSEAIGAPVTIRAIESELSSRLGGVKTIQTNEKGEFSFFSLPPGRYEVFSSFAPVEPGADKPKGASVTLEEGAEKELQITLSEPN